MATTKKYSYDVLVIGGGSAGLAAAEAAVAEGARVCIVEREALGGDCPHWACVPTKTLLRSATMYDALRHAGRFGIAARNVRFSFRAMAARRQRVVGTVTGNGKRLFARMEEIGVDVVYGDARFVDATTVVVGKKKLSARAFVVATGAEDVVPPIAGVHDVPFLTSRDVTQLRTLPKSVCIVGGGPVGCEFATLFSLLGSTTTLVETGDRLLPREDIDIATLAAAALRGHGATVATGTKVLGVARAGKRVRVTYQTGDRPRATMTVDAFVVAAGRRPRVQGLGLDALKEQPNVVYAGDAAGGMQFTHVAHYEGAQAGVVAARGAGSVDVMPRVVPRVTFVSPEVASVGLTEADARKGRKAVRVARFPVGALSRAVVDDERDGLLKVITDTRGKILGAHMTGSHAGEVVHELALAMHANISFADVASMLHAFPTYSEAIPAAFDALM